MKQYHRNILPASLLALSSLVFGSACNAIRINAAGSQTITFDDSNKLGFPNEDPNSDPETDTKLTVVRHGIPWVSLEAVLFEFKEIKLQSNPEFSPHVSEIQRMIKTLMPEAFPVFGIDGKPGKEFQTWVIKFQQAEDLIAHGKVDRATLVRLLDRSTDPSSPAVENRTKLIKLPAFNRLDPDLKKALTEEFYFLLDRDQEVLLELFSLKSLEDQADRQLNQLAQRFRVSSSKARATLLELGKRKLPGLETYALFDQTSITIPGLKLADTIIEARRVSLPLLNYFAYAISPVYIDQQFTQEERERLADTVIEKANPLDLKQSRYHGRCGAVAFLTLLKHYRPAEALRIEMGLLGPEKSVQLLDGKTVLQRAGKFSWKEGDYNLSMLQEIVVSAIMEYANGSEIYDNLNDSHIDPETGNSSRHGVSMYMLKRLLVASGLNAQWFKADSNIRFGTSPEVLLQRLQQPGGEFAILNLTWRESSLEERAAGLPNHAAHAVNFDKLVGEYTYYYNPHRINDYPIGTRLSDPPREILDRNGHERMLTRDLLARLTEVLAINMSTPGGRTEAR
ncbi:MAG: hypothetical protein R3A13_05530 [Bdellovibrionota bacterium]